MIEVGYEIGSGRPVKVPADRHIAVTGQTQLSGKTTTLEALVDRSNITAVAFVTKRGEGRFQYGSQVQPYFRTPLDPSTRDVDWQFVESVLGSTLNEKMKSDSLRLAIIKATAKAKSLAQVHENVAELLDDAKGAREGVYTLLDAYFRKVIPELEQSNYSNTLDLHKGLNVMDISESTENVQQLVIRSVAQTVMEKRRNTCIILPEAWMFIPEKNNTPAKSALIHMIRAGAGIGNLLWLDSQDFAGISKIVMRAMGVWFVGAQQEYNEVLRVLETAVVPTKLAAHEIKTLGIGQFFVLYDTNRFKTYIQPLWADAHSSAMYAAGKGKMPTMPPGPRRESDSVIVVRDSVPFTAPRTVDQNEKTENAWRDVRGVHGNASGTSTASHQRLGDTTPTPTSDKKRGDADRSASEGSGSGRDAAAVVSYEEIKARLLKDAEVIQALVVLQDRSEIKIRTVRKELPVEGNSVLGAVALMISKDLFNEGTKVEAVRQYCLSRGVINQKDNNRHILKALDELVVGGFLIRAGQSYHIGENVRVTLEETP